MSNNTRASVPLIGVNFGFPSEPRASTETERRHLLLETDSIAPSESASILEHQLDDGQQTPRPRSSRNLLQPSHSQPSTSAPQKSDPPQPQPYRGFPSQEAYLAALTEWAEAKKYTDAGQNGLVGFYGDTTMGDMASRPGLPEMGIMRRYRERKESLKRRLRGGSRVGIEEGEGLGERRATVG